MSSRWLVCVAMTVGVAAVAPSVAQAGTLDQEQTAMYGFWGVGVGSTPAQTFTASRSGRLDRVDLGLFKRGNPGDLTVQIRGVNADGTPSATVLGSTTVPAATIGFDAQQWLSVPISAPSAAGTKYAIVLSNPISDSCLLGSSDQCYFWGTSDGDLYSRGIGYLKLGTAADSGWHSELYGHMYDYKFRTYVASCPEVAPAGLVSGIVYGLGKTLSLKPVQQLACSTSPL